MQGGSARIVAALHSSSSGFARSTPSRPPTLPVRRGPYCGAVLWVDAAGAMGSSILIRTFVADGRRLTIHVGGGITWRSDTDTECEETRAKARGPLRAIGGRAVGVEEP